MKEQAERLENIRRLNTTVRAAKSRQIQKILDESQKERNDMTQAFSFEQANVSVKKECLEQIRICNDNNMIPCLYLLDPGTMTPPSHGLNLINTATREPVDPMEISTGEPAEMSDWEMHNFAIQVAIQNLISKGFEIGSFCDYPGIAPNIWFSMKEPAPLSLAFVRGRKGRQAPTNQIEIPD